LPTPSLGPKLSIQTNLVSYSTMEDKRFTQPFLKILEEVAALRATDLEGSKKLFLKRLKELGWRERLNNLYRIKDKQDGKFKFFRPNREQRRFLESKKLRNLINKARQIGFTTISCVYAYDRAFFDDWSTGIMSHHQKKTEKIFSIVKYCDDWFERDWGKLLPDKPKEFNSANQISWADTKASVTVAFDFRSLTVRFLHISEAALIDDDRLSISLQSVPEVGEVVLESTPEGAAGLFYEQWQNWKNMGDLAPYKGFFFPWYEFYPEDHSKWEGKDLGVLSDKEVYLKEQLKLKDSSLAWRRWKLASDYKNREDAFEKDYPTDDESCFLSGEALVYSPTTLKAQKRFVKEPSHIGFTKKEGKKVSFYADTKGLIKIWKLPSASGDYCIGADSAEGVGKDYAVAYVIDRDTGEVAAQLRGQIPPALFAEELWKLGKFYNDCYICPEYNYHGVLVVSELIRMGYSRLYKRYTTDEMTNRPTTKVGFLTTVSTKITLTEQHVTACRQLEFRCTSEDLLKEMSTFVQHSSKSGRSFTRAARRDAHDDCVMAACLAWEMHKKMGNSSKGDVTLPDIVRFSSIDPDTGDYTYNTRWDDDDGTREHEYY